MKIEETKKNSWLTDGMVSTINSCHPTLDAKRREILATLPALVEQKRYDEMERQWADENDRVQQASMTIIALRRTLAETDEDRDTLRARVAELEAAPLAAYEPLTDDEAMAVWRSGWDLGPNVEPVVWTRAEVVDRIRAEIAKYRTLRPARAASVRMPTVYQSNELAHDILKAPSAMHWSILCEHLSRWAGAEASSPPSGAPEPGEPIVVEAPPTDAECRELYNAQHQAGCDAWTQIRAIVKRYTQLRPQRVMVLAAPAAKPEDAEPVTLGMLRQVLAAHSMNYYGAGWMDALSRTDDVLAAAKRRAGGAQ